MVFTFYFVFFFSNYLFIFYDSYYDRPKFTRDCRDKFFYLLSFHPTEHEIKVLSKQVNHFFFFVSKKLQYFDTNIYTCNSFTKILYNILYYIFLNEIILRNNNLSLLKILYPFYISIYLQHKKSTTGKNAFFLS